MSMTTRSRAAATKPRGQVLVLFALFLLMLLGISALAIDYASWLVVDRSLQNTADHAALAGASEFEDRTGGTNCAGVKCYNARAQAWTSLNDELNLGLPSTAIGVLATTNSPAAGVNSVVAGGTTYALKDRIWVTTPPPSYTAYTSAGGRYAGNEGVVYVRVDRIVPSFLGGVLGITPGPRTGWATAGALPSGYALQTFCRNSISPQSGVCENSAGLTIDGQGGIRLLSGDIGTNESLKVTGSTGQGVVLDDGNTFVVNGTCQSSTWNCPNGPPSLGGISDSTGTGKNAFYMAPLPVPQYESPVDYAALSVCSDSTTWNDTSSPNYHVPCVPYRNQAGTDPAPNAGQWVGDWTCDTTVNGVFVDCGVPNTSTSPPVCSGGNFDEFYRPNTDDLNNNPRWQGSPVNSNGDRYQNIKEAAIDPTGSLPATVPGSASLSGAPTSWVSSQNGATNAYRVGLDGVEGVHAGGSLVVRYVLFRTANNVPDTNAGPAVGVTVSLKERTGGGPGGLVTRGTPDVVSATQTVTVYQFAVPIASMTGATWYNNLYLEFQVTTPQAAYGAGISWAEVEELNLQPRQAPRIPPGYWHSITIPANKCALLDPSHATGVMQYQLPGIYRFGGGGTGSSAPRIVVGSGAFLIGDGVSLVFDPRVGSNGFPDNGIDIGTNAAMLINAGATPDPPLTALPFAGANAAWQVDPNDSTNPRNGENTWPVCTRGGNECVPRSCYMNTDPDPLGTCAGQTVTLLSGGRGVAFYLTPNSWNPATAQIQRRFYMGGTGSTDAPGIAFKGVLYAPYDDVKITGRNGFNTVGQVLAWTAKFNGGSAYIYLEYPYTDKPSPPYLLEPTIAH
jgi:Flp pilus assembly protein TadG